MIYTAVSGGRDNIRTDIKCFTDYDRFNTGRMNAKIYKVLSHLFVDGLWSVWIDANLFLKVSEKELIELAGDSDMAVFKNPYRKNIFDEGMECIRLGLDDEETISEQLLRYKNEGFDINGSGLGACFLIIRKNTPEINRLNEKWWAEICRGSSRDQISFPYVYGDKVKYLDDINPFDNQYFKRIGHKK